MTKWTADEICTVYFESGTFELADSLGLKQFLAFDKNTWTMIKSEGYITGDAFGFCADGWSVKRIVFKGLINKVRVTCKWRE